MDFSIERIFSYAAWADKFDGAVHNPPFRNIAIAMNEPIGTVGLICPAETPLLGFLSLVMPLLAMGNTVIAVPSEKYPLIAGDLYQLFDTSDIPGGAMNIVTGYVSQLLKTLAEHDDIDAIWCYGDEATVACGKSNVDRKPQAGLDQRRPRHRLVRSQGCGRTLVPGARDSGQKHLGSLRRVAGVPAMLAPILLPKFSACPALLLSMRRG